MHCDVIVMSLCTTFILSFFKQEVLKQLQGTIEEESGEASGSQLELIERLKGERNKHASGRTCSTHTVLLICVVHILYTLHIFIVFIM